MVEVSIICLIYKSKQLAEAVYESLYKYTPKLKNGEADLLFVANDPTTELVEYLDLKKYPYIINVNEHLSESELFKLGYGAPEYIRRVYQGYNRGIIKAKGQKIVLINSDNFFSEDWLENLLKYSDYKKVVCSTLVEPGQDKFDVFPCALQNNFGKVVDDYDDDGFQKYVSEISKTGYTSGGAYMPCLLYKDIAVMAGLYPEGNIAGKSFNEINDFGDEFFYKKLKEFGVDHITAKDSIVYHLKEGEKSEDLETEEIIKDKSYNQVNLISKNKIKPRDLINYIKPDGEHLEIMEKLGNKITVIIMHFWSVEELQLQIDQILNQKFNKIEIIVIYSNKELIGDKSDNVRYIYADNAMRYSVVFDILHKMYGEYLLVTNPKGIYQVGLFDKIIDKNSVYHLGGDIFENNVTDSIGNFIIPKSILLNQINNFIVPYLSNNEIKIKKSKLKIEFIEIQETIDASDVQIPNYKKTLPYRALRKLYREGFISALKVAYSKIKRKLS